MFKRKRQIDHPQLGALSHRDGEWHTVQAIKTPAGSTFVAVAGGADGPDPAAVDLALRTLATAQDVVSVARVFAHAHKPAAAFLENHGALELDGFTFRGDAVFSVQFGLAKRPDATVDVRFSEGRPQDVWLAD